MDEYGPINDFLSVLSHCVVMGSQRVAYTPGVTWHLPHMPIAHISIKNNGVPKIEVVGQKWSEMPIMVQMTHEMGTIKLLDQN